MLIINGGKERSANSMHLLRPTFIFKTDQYISGRLEAIGLINGKSVARTHRTTPEKTYHHLKLKIDLSEKPLTNNDVLFVYAYAMKTML